MKPIIKWAGGKTQLLPEIKVRLPKDYKRYVEPFLGGGAVLLFLGPQQAIVNDLNTELINMYKTVKSYPNALMEKLDSHEDNLSEEYYYQIRQLDRVVGLNNLTSIYRASRFIFLNKAGFNGLYRVNSSGFFNVPFGKKETLNLYESNNILKISSYFNENEILFKNEDYSTFLLKNVKKGDFVYLDPPYDVPEGSQSFTQYQKEGFTQQNQKKLRDICLELDERGAYIMLSNSHTEYILNLYDHPVFNVDIVEARRSINSNGNERGKVKEVIIRNYL